MVNCWAGLSDSSGCSVGYTRVGATIFPTPPATLEPPPALQYPDYTYPSTVWNSNTYYGSTCGAPSNVETRVAPIWGYYCTPVLPTPWNVISTGPYSIDVGATGGDQRAPTADPFTLYQGHAIACRFYPKLRFVPYIVVHNVTSLLSGKKTVVEIKANGPGNLPIGVPGDNNVLARISTLWPVVTTEWPNVFANYSIPINAVLADSATFVPDSPYWIVMYSEDYTCADPFIVSPYERVKFYKATTGYNDTAIWAARGGITCSWVMEPTIDSLAFATYTSATGTPAINVTDFGFAEMVPTPAYINANCFAARVNMEGKNTAIGIDFATPRHYQRVRFSIVYKKPDGRFKNLLYDITDIPMGTNRIFIDTEELYMPGVYTNIAVTATVVTV